MDGVIPSARRVEKGSKCGRQTMFLSFTLLGRWAFSVALHRSRLSLLFRMLQTDHWSHFRSLAYNMKTCGNGSNSFSSALVACITCCRDCNKSKCKRINYKRTINSYIKSFQVYVVVPISKQEQYKARQRTYQVHNTITYLVE
jgi:hypothetical protein